MEKKVINSNMELMLNINRLKMELKNKILERAEAFPALGLLTDKKIAVYLAEDAFWELAILLGEYLNKTKNEQDQAFFKLLITEIRETMGKIARTSIAPQTVVFGTSGWRDPIGEDFSIHNVHKVVRSIIEMMKTDSFLTQNKYTSFEQVKENGLVVFRDNRFMGDEFINVAIAELTAQGIKVHLAGECPTGVGSALVTELGAAGSINFTPSHNPMNYAGLKFNPADGGPADTNLTAVIEKIANGYMQENEFIAAQRTNDNETLVTRVNAAKMFKVFYEKKAPGAIEGLKDYLRSVKHDLFLIVDNMHGSSRGYLEAILGAVFIAEMGNSIIFINTNDDYSFHGVKPEPSAKNQTPIIEMLKSSGKKYTLGVALDPDADRIRFATANMDIDMNSFAPMAYAAMLESGLKGGIAYSVATTGWAGSIAAVHDQKVYQTAVGFKNFREPLTKGNALMAFEESDGFTRFTLEKCAIQGFLAALDIMKKKNKNLDEYYTDCQKKYGYYYPDKDGVEVKGVSVEEWQSYKKKVVNVLTDNLYALGDTLTVADVKKTVAEVITVDGLKLIFDDNSWLLMRPSGTEPKFRFYFEMTGKGSDQNAASYKNSAAGVLSQARILVEK